MTASDYVRISGSAVLTVDSGVAGYFVTLRELDGEPLLKAGLFYHDNPDDARSEMLQIAQDDKKHGGIF